MKTALLLFVFLGSAKYCSKVDLYQNHINRLNNDHPPIVHKMESILADARSSDDSLTADWADGLWKNFEADFNAYNPVEVEVRKLYKLDKTGLEIKVIGGNWCSDTREQLPRLCKVLHLAGFDPENFYYFQVDRAKKAVLNDFASQYKVVSVPTVLLFKKGKEIGKIVETPKISWEKNLVEISKN